MLETSIKWAVKMFLSTNSIKDTSEIYKVTDDVMTYARYGKVFNSGRPIMDIAEKATVAYFRHKWTNYDKLIQGKEFVDYHELANKQARRQINRWKKKKKPLSIKRII